MSFDAHSFPHRRLTAYTSALEMARQAKLIADGIPRGYRSFADQLLRAAGATVLLVAEGANRRSRGSKWQRFEEALGECGEAAGNVEMLLTIGLVDAAVADEFADVAGRTGAMIAGLARRLR